jgi:NADH-quinone oxidoreductase subunit J
MVLIPGKEETGPDPLRGQRLLTVPLVAVFLVLIALVLRSTILRGSGPGAALPGGVETVGRLLFTDYLFPFEVTSLLLLVAIVGVIALAKRHVDGE